MKISKRSRKQPHGPRSTRCRLALALMALATAPLAHAFQFETDDPDLKVLWDTTVKYSAAWRLKNPSSALTSQPSVNFTDTNTDDGDRNFRKGLISNRLDLLTELDVSYHGWGGRVSGAAWYDTVYNRSNDNDSAATNNNWSVANDQFTSATKRLHGRQAELLDAFVFGKFDIGDSKATFRAGRHTLLWGESLFFGANGIANGQGSIDVVKAVSVPNTQFKELMRPVNQVSGQLQLTPDVLVGAYYQLEWEKLRLPAAGSYFSGVDFFGDGGERLIVAPAGGPFANPIAFFRAPDMKAKDSGQGGLQLRFRSNDVDYGLYAIRYHDKAPQIYQRLNAVPNFATGEIGKYLWVYPENITSYGASATTTVGEVNFAGEVSVRRNTPLSSGAALDLTGTGNNSNNPLYGVGNSVHAQVSWLASLGPSFISKEADFVGELALNKVTSITKNEAIVAPNGTRSASNIRIVYEPKYRQVMPGLDLSVPVGLGYGIKGNSMVVGAFNGEGVGDLSIGVSGAYLDVWRFGLNYTHYFGPQGKMFDAAGNTYFKQTLADRDFIALSVRRTF